MAAGDDVLVFGCGEVDLAVLRRAFGRRGLVLRVADSPEAFAREALSRQPLAAFLGLGRRTTARLEVVPLIHAVRHELPVIVVAEDDSLELERSAREKGIFYYLVRPIEASEVRAVLQDLLRRAEGRTT